MIPERVIQEMCDLQGNTYKVTDEYIYVTLKDGHTRKHDLNLNFVADIPKSTASDNERVKKAIEKLEAIGENDIAEFARQSFDLITKQRAEIADLTAQIKILEESIDRWTRRAQDQYAKIAELEVDKIEMRSCWEEDNAATAACIKELAAALKAITHVLLESVPEESRVLMMAIIEDHIPAYRQKAKKQLQAEGLVAEDEA
jgi:hypothetical protein